MLEVIKKTVGLGSTKYQSVGVVIPKKIANKIGLNRDDYVKIYLDGDKIVIEKIDLEKVT